MKNNLKKAATALITGATCGIGYELCRLMAREGNSLVLVARNKERLEKVAAELQREFKIKAQVIPKDLSGATASAEICAELEKKNIHIDILVNNAGFNEYGPFADTDLKKELQMIQVNMVSLTHLTKLLLPGMLKQNFGQILNVGSTGSFGPGPLNAVYCATKAYVLSFSEAIAEELRGTGVTVTTLCPGVTRTEFASRAGMEESRLFQGKLMDAGEVAQIGYHALKQGKSSVVAGCGNKLTIFSLRFIPRDIAVRMVKGLMSKKPTGKAAFKGI